jgi:membrane-bound inhibitor of C-type lysozyme
MLVSKFRATFVVGLTLLLLATSVAYAAVPVAIVTFKCQGAKTIEATFYGDKVDLKLSDGRALSVPQAMSASGARYANKDETFVFWNKGDTAFVTEGKDGKETYSGCVTMK